MQFSEYLTTQEAANVLRVSTDTIIRNFEKRKGVLVLSSSESLSRRRYRSLRIPREALEQFIIESRVQ